MSCRHVSCAICEPQLDRETRSLVERAERAETHLTKLWKDFSRFYHAAILAHGAADWEHPEDGEAFMRRIQMAKEALDRTTDSVCPDTTEENKK